MLNVCSKSSFHELTALPNVLAQTTTAKPSGLSLETMSYTFWPNQWPDGLGEILRIAIFAMTLVNTFLMGIVAYVNPAERWRHLRAHAMEIASIIWKYRTRTDIFSSSGGKNSPPDVKDDSESTEELTPDKALHKSLTSWRTRLVNSSDLSLTLLQRRPLPTSNVYKHGQYKTVSMLVAMM